MLWIESAEMAKLFWSQEGDVERIFTLAPVHRCEKLKTSLSLRLHILINRFKFTPLHRVDGYKISEKYKAASSCSQVLDKNHIYMNLCL